jgi:gliding motility-associated lipoprotein GldH
MHKPFLIATLFGSMLLGACGKGVLYEQNISVEDELWKASVPAVFELNVEDTVQGYDFFINIRNTGSYRYSNMYLFIGTVFPDGKSIRDTVECILATPEGKWLGSGVGDLHEQSILFKRSVNFPLKGTYRFEMVQAMREDPLPGISDIGLRIEKSKNVQ